MKKKKIIIVLIALIVVIGLLIGLYFYGLTPVSKNDTTQEFKVNTGDSKINIVDNLKESGLIKSKISLYIYVSLNRDLNLQAGTYELSPNMSAKEILDKLNNGDIIIDDNTYSITFVEGKRLTQYASQIADATNTTTEEVLNIMSDEEYLKELISTYWFLTEDILNDNIYYPLEGYLHPSTYELYNESTPQDIIIKMLDGTNNILEPLKNSIETSNYTVHEILTMASIVEQEGANSDDRAGVAGVFYNRLNSGWTLGSDATTYYAVNKDYSSDLSSDDLASCNGYNTRGNCVSALPVGPICSPSLSSITAAITPSTHDYYFFVADKNKKTYFTKTSAEHSAIINELKNTGLWYEYN